MKNKTTILIVAAMTFALVSTSRANPYVHNMGSTGANASANVYRGGSTTINNNVYRTSTTYYSGNGGGRNYGGYYGGGGGYYGGGCNNGGWYGTGIPNGLGWTLFGLAAGSAILGGGGGYYGGAPAVVYVPTAPPPSVPAGYQLIPIAQ